jgi:hypothetical protein
MGLCYKTTTTLSPHARCGQVLSKAVIKSRRSFSERKPRPGKQKLKSGRKCFAFCFRKTLGKICLHLVRTLELCQFRFISNDHIVYEAKGNCCRRALEKFKEEIITELPKKIDQEVDAHFTLRTGKLKSRLKQIVCNCTEGLLQAFLGREFRAQTTQRNSKSKAISLVANRDTTLSPNGFPTQFSVKVSRRRANSEVSTSPKSSNHTSKRLATQMNGL